MIIEQSPESINCNKKRRLHAPSWHTYYRLNVWEKDRQATPGGSLRRCPLNLTFHLEHLIFEAQLQFLQPHFF